jgi:hypothetical protein
VLFRFSPARRGESAQKKRKTYQRKRMRERDSCQWRERERERERENEMKHQAHIDGTQPTTACESTKHKLGQKLQAACKH